MLKQTSGVLSFGVALAGSMLSAAPASAYEQWFCGPQNAVTFRSDTCYTPAGGSEEAVIRFAMAAWNRPTGIYDKLLFATGDNNCTFEPLANGRYQVALVARSNALLGGRSGNTVWDDSVVNGCARLTQATVAVDQAFPLGDRSELDTAIGAREIAIHEFGHTMGLGHEEDVPAVMCDHGECGKFGTQNRSGTKLWRGESLFPDEVSFGLAVHGSGTTGYPDPAVSPWSWGPSTSTLNYPGRPIRTLCPGAVTNIVYSFGNLGTQQFNFADISIYMSSNTSISTGDALMGTDAVWATVGGSATISTNVVVPSLAAGTYEVGVIIDPNNALTQQDAGNDSMQTGLRIRIPTGC